MTAAIALDAIEIDPTAPSVTVREATKVRPLSKWTIYRLIESGRLPAWRIGNGRIRFALADLDKLIVRAGPAPQAKRRD